MRRRGLRRARAGKRVVLNREAAVVLVGTEIGCTITPLFSALAAPVDHPEVVGVKTDIERSLRVSANCQRWRMTPRDVR
jgi:hypothetical protein